MKEPTIMLKFQRAAPDPTESVTGIVLEAMRQTDGTIVNSRQTSHVSPQWMLGLLTYCYAKGIYGSSDIERELRERSHDEAIPDAKTIRRFRRLNRGVLQMTLERALRLIRRARRQKFLPVPAPEIAASEETIVITRREAAEKIETAAIIDMETLD